MTRHSLFAAVVAAAALAPASSLAAADRNATLDPAHTSYTWDSKLGTGFTTLSNFHNTIPCGTPGVHDCDFTLVKVTDPEFPGILSVTNESSDPNAVDTDLYVYLSDADGTNQGQLANSAQGSPTPNEATSVSTDVGTNWFLVEIDYTDNVAGTIHGTLTYTPTPPEPEE